MSEHIVVIENPLDKLASSIANLPETYLRKLGERGYELLREEVPGEGRLKAGVQKPTFKFKEGEAEVVVTAKSGPTGVRYAEVFDRHHHKKKVVTLRPQPAYDYAEVVARGNLKPVIFPRIAKALIIPVATPPVDEGYLKVGPFFYIVRRSRAGIPANPYDERAAQRLTEESPEIAAEALGEAIDKEGLSTDA